MGDWSYSVNGGAYTRILRLTSGGALGFGSDSDWGFADTAGARIGFMGDADDGIGVQLDNSSNNQLFVLSAGGTDAGSLRVLNLKTTEKLLFSGTAPSSPVACTSPSVVNNNGTATSEIDVGTTCAGISTLVITYPTATTMYGCVATNLTNPATSAPAMTASTTTSVTITNYARTTGLAADWTDGDNVRVSCFGG